MSDFLAAGGKQDDEVTLARSTTRLVVTRGPVHEVDAGFYYAIIRAGVPMIERADTAGCVYAIEFDDEAARERWKQAL